MLRKPLVLIAGIILAGMSAAPAKAEPRPLWELGIGAIGLSLPDYRGSDERRGYLYPFPYLVYRGESLRVDRQGVRGIFFSSQSVEVDLSVYGTPPVDSSNNAARSGMPDLDPTIELGPLLSMTLLRDREKDRRLDLRFPLRAVIATDLRHTQQAGYVFNPHLSLALRPEVLEGRWNLGMQLGPLFATRQYHQYFYGVDTQFATPERPAYAARGGYSGMLALASISRRFNGYWLGGFARYDTLKGAVFEGSPLMRRQQSYMAGIAFAWVFAQSDRKVEANE
jgi:outer membrane scaffolding protein for murein synthesis (MipA/OmpV family)